MDRKNQNLYYIKILMGVINFIILSFLSAVFILTLNKINCDFGARNFLENITYLPNEPVTSTVLIFIAFFLFSSVGLKTLAAGFSAALSVVFSTLSSRKKRMNNSKYHFFFDNFKLQMKWELDMMWVLISSQCDKFLLIMDVPFNIKP